MLTSRSKDLKVSYTNISADNNSGTCSWTADYTFSKTGRPVHNIINASFTFKDGKILSHKDDSNATSAPDFIVREWLERGAEIPQSFTGPHGDSYALRQLYTAPLLSGATAGVYAKQASQ